MSSSSSHRPPSNINDDDLLEQPQPDPPVADPQFIDVVQLEADAEEQAQLETAQSVSDSINIPEDDDDDDPDPPPARPDPVLQAVEDSAAQTLVNVVTSSLIVPRIERRHTTEPTRSRSSPPLPALPENVHVHHQSGGGGGNRYIVGEDGVPQMQEIQSASRIRIVDSQRPDRGPRRPSASQATDPIYRQGSLNNRSFREGPAGIVEGDRIGAGNGYSPNRTRSVENDIDNFVPVLPHSQQQQQQQQQHRRGNGIGNGNGDGRQRQSRRWSTGVVSGLSVHDRIQLTLDHAKEECGKFKIKARATGLALNVAIGLQVFISALITGLSASKRGGFGVAILGGVGTIIASYLARARGSNEPELSTARVKDLERYIRDCEAFIQDHGFEEPSERTNRKIDDLRSQFEELLGNGDGQRKLSTPI